MAGIKETKEQLLNELKELHSKLSGMHGILFVTNVSPSAWLEYAEILNEFSKKAAVLAHLMIIDEPQKEMEVPPTLVPEIKLPETIVPPFPVVEKNTPPIVQSPPSQGGKTYPDLKSLMGFNEKVMFMRYLFNSGGTDYENAIAEINACASYREAEVVLQNLAAARSWSQASEPVQVFFSLVKRRFA